MNFDWELIDAVKEWKSAQCFDCDEHFVAQAEANEHRKVFGHKDVLHRFEHRTVKL
jgi:hypothetical protein